jgi:hypothetical protein
MKKAWLYITTNLVNGKKYIGQTTSSRKNYIGSGSVIMSAIKKYGKENFLRENIYEDDWEFIDLLEQEYIEKYDAVNSPLYYNQKPGGYYSTHSAVSRKIMSEKAIGRKVSAESKQQRSENMKGEKNPMYGKKRTDDEKERIRQKVLLNNPQRGTFWWNNEVEEIRSKECPGLEWKKGRLEKCRDSNGKFVCSINN